MGVCRNEIYNCNLKPSYKFCIVGLHPVIVVSSFKHLLKNDTIQVLPITSNVKRICKSHIAINGFGLDLNSKIMCEMLLTVNKSDLQTRIGKVDNVKMHEVNIKLKQHLQLSKEHKNLDSDNMEELFFMGAKNMDIKQRMLNILKSEIKTAYLKDENEKCMKLLEELVKSSKENKFLWFGYYSKSLIYMRYNDMDNALINAKKSIQYIDEVDILNQDYTLSMFALARCYSSTDVNKAIETYKTLSHIYRELTDDRLRLSCVFNIAKLNNNHRAMRKLINIVENTNTHSWYFGIDRDKFLEDMKLELDTLMSI